MPEAESSRKQPGATDDPLVGRVLNGRFTIVAPLGAGGMGRVYRAIQQPLDRVVALKVLHPQFANSKDPGFVKRFVLEASMTSKLRHPNTVTVIDYGQTEAARSLGMTARQTMVRVVFPQAVKNILPALCNEFVTVIKETSLASTFFIGDLMTSYNVIKGAMYLVLEPLIVVGIIYFVLTFTLSKAIAVLERRLKASD
jgi:serine/threonine protein kinase